MEQTASKERAMSYLTKKIGQTTYKVNVFFAENTTSTFEDKLLHLMANDIANRKQGTQTYYFLADIFISRKEFCMGKSTKTYEERIQEKDLRIEKLAQELKRYEAQKKQLEKRRKEEERKIRTHRLIEIGAAVESVLGRCIELEEIPKLIAFLNKQEANGKFFSKAMQKGPDTDMKKEECGESGVS